MQGCFRRDHLPQPRSDRNWLKHRARARGDILHMERICSCHFADSAGAGHGAQKLEWCMAVRSLKEDMPGFQ